MNPQSLTIAVRRALALLTAVGLVGSLLLTSVNVLAANPSATLDQCANGSLGSPNNPACDPAQWVNGNLGASKAHYFEGDSVPYRLRFDNLSVAGTHEVTIEWDTTKSGKHALDYLTTFNRTVSTANPCVGVGTGCDPTSFDTEPIPADPQVTGASVTPIAGVFNLYGGTITGLSTYSYADGAGFAGDKSARITVSFSATVANPVLAWGGHISTRLDWGQAASAVSIPGSPYHMRLIDLDGAGGNQDRSLSSDAVIFPGSITIIKDASPNDPQDFAFSTTGGLTPSTFSLDDDGDPTLSNTRLYSNIGTFGSYTVAETTVTGWSLSLATPPCVLSSPNGGGSSASGSTVTITMKEGENYSCTFTNTAVAPKLRLVKSVTNDAGGTKTAADWTLTATGSSGGFSDTGDSSTKHTVTAGVQYTLSESTVAGYQAGSAWSCTGGTFASPDAITLALSEDVTCTITNNDIAPTLKLVKVVDNTNGGTNAAADWTLSATGTGGFSAAGDEGQFHTVTAGGTGYALSESGPSSPTATYDASSWSCDGGTLVGSTITLGLAETVTCTITNTSRKFGPSGSTTMGWYAKDSGSFSIRAGAADASGATIAFKLYSNNACTTQVDTTVTITVTLNGAGDQASAAMTQAQAIGVSPGTYYWQATYSGDGFNTSTTTTCGDEVTTISVP